MTSARAGSLIGTVVDRVQFVVEAGKILEFARATLAQDDAHDGEARPVPLATATHVVVAGHHRDQRAFVSALGLDITRIVVGSVKWEFERPLRAGDRLAGERVVVGDETREGRRGGSMRLVTLETTFVDADAAVAVRQREVLIERASS